MGERRSLSHSFLLGLNLRGNKKREARTQLFIIDPIVGLDLFLSDPPPLRKQLHRTVVIKNHKTANLIIMNSFHVANKKRIKMYFLVVDSFFCVKPAFFRK
jgi:hypothetical protein